MRVAFKGPCRQTPQVGAIHAALGHSDHTRTLPDDEFRNDIGLTLGLIISRWSVEKNIFGKVLAGKRLLQNVQAELFCRSFDTPAEGCRVKLVSIVQRGRACAVNLGCMKDVCGEEPGGVYRGNNVKFCVCCLGGHCWE